MLRCIMLGHIMLRHVFCASYWLVCCLHSHSNGRSGALVTCRSSVPVTRTACPQLKGLTRTAVGVQAKRATIQKRPPPPWPAAAPLPPLLPWTISPRSTRQPPPEVCRPLRHLTPFGRANSPRTPLSNTGMCRGRTALTPPLERQSPTRGSDRWPCPRSPSPSSRVRASYATLDHQMVSPETYPPPPLRRPLPQLLGTPLTRSGKAAPLASGSVVKVTVSTATSLRAGQCLRSPSWIRQLALPVTTEVLS